MIKNTSKLIIEDYKSEFAFKKKMTGLNIQFNRVAFIFFIFFIIYLIYTIHLIHLGTRKNKSRKSRGPSPWITHVKTVAKTIKKIVVII